MKTPLKVPGGKFFGRHIIKRYFPRDIPAYYEPFAGAGHLFCALEPRPDEVILADADPSLMQLWACVQGNVDALIEAIGDLPAVCTRKAWDTVFSENGGHSYRRAARTYWLMQMSWAGDRKQAMLSPRTYGAQRLPTGWAAGLGALSDRLRDVDLRCEDFGLTLPSISHDVFVYADPPDIKSRGAHLAYKGDHERLAQLLQDFASRGGRFVVTYREAPLIRNLYDWCTIVPITWTYGAKRELLIMPG